MTHDNNSTPCMPVWRYVALDVHCRSHGCRLRKIYETQSRTAIHTLLHA